MISAKIIFRIIGSLLFIECSMMLICTILAYCMNETCIFAFGCSTAITLLMGFLMKSLGLSSGNQLNRREAYFTVAITWIVFSVFGTIPLLLGGYCHTVGSALFETMSGFTTTGATNINNVDALPYSVLLWRSMMQWIGGLGIIFFTLTIMPSGGAGGVKLFSAEATGIAQERLHPHIHTTAMWVWSLYLIITISCAVVYWLCGMNIFDSINHALTTTATGGFSTHQEGVMFFNSPLIEYCMIFFMFISGINFFIIYSTFQKKRLSIITDNSELKCYGCITLILSVVIFIALISYSNYGVERAIRTALFNCISLQTTTGYVSDNYMCWFKPLFFVLSFLMFTGACSGSTSGGFKSIRILIVFKTGIAHFKRLLHPNAILPVHINHVPIQDGLERNILAFLFWTIVLTITGAILLCCTGLPLLDSTSISLSCVNNIGPTLGNVYGPLNDFSSLPEISKWICSFLMLAGRLEIFALFLPMTSSFWKRV